MVFSRQSGRLTRLTKGLKESSPRVYGEVGYASGEAEPQRLAGYGARPSERSPDLAGENETTNYLVKSDLFT